MRSELDGRMDGMMAALTAEGGMFQLTHVERFGARLPVIAAAPPSLTHYFRHFAATHADATFLVSGEERLTFAEVQALAERIARALVAEHGIGRGDRVGIAMRNSPSWILLYMGIVMAGGIATLLNGWWQTDELAAGIAEADCRLVFVDPPRARRLEARSDLPLVVIDDAPPVSTALASLLGVGAAAELPDLGPDDLASILFTSGSTGQSKGALSDHRGVLGGVFSFLAQAVMMLGLAEQDGTAPAGQPSTLLTLPLFHVTAEVTVFLQSFALGRKLVLMPKWDAREAMRLIQRERISYFVGVPLMSYEILTHPERTAFDLSSVTDFAAGGAPRPVEHVRRIAAEMGGPAPLIGYGLTETNAVGSGNWRSNYLAKPSSAGRPSRPLVEIAILDDAGTHLPSGEDGEIGIRSVANFREYWRRPAATAAAITADGYFRTGDIGHLDEDGYLFIVDRKKDIIIRGGENISCIEVEAALYEHPLVAEAAVFGLADERFGEIPAAVIHARAPVDGAEIVAFLATRIAAFKVPGRIWIAAEPLPRLGTEKIDKVSLRAAYRAIAAEEAA